jgi:hypothetical protein
MARNATSYTYVGHCENLLVTTILDDRVRVPNPLSPFSRYVTISDLAICIYTSRHHQIARDQNLLQLLALVNRTTSDGAVQPAEHVDRHEHS